MARIQDVIGEINEFNTTVPSAVEEQSATTQVMTQAISEAAMGSAEVSKVVSAVAEVAKATSDSARASLDASEHLGRVRPEAERPGRLVQVLIVHPPVRRTTP